MEAEEVAGVEDGSAGDSNAAADSGSDDSSDDELPPGWIDPKKSEAIAGWWRVCRALGRVCWKWVVLVRPCSALM